MIHLAGQTFKCLVSMSFNLKKDVYHNHSMLQPRFCKVSVYLIIIPLARLKPVIKSKKRLLNDNFCLRATENK